MISLPQAGPRILEQIDPECMLALAFLSSSSPTGDSFHLVFALAGLDRAA